MDLGVKTMKSSVAQSAEIVEYADCISKRGEHAPNKCPGYDTKLYSVVKLQP